MAMSPSFNLVSFPDPPAEGLGDGPIRACISAGICAEPIKSTNYNLAGSQSKLWEQQVRYENVMELAMAFSLSQLGYQKLRKKRAKVLHAFVGGRDVLLLFPQATVSPRASLRCRLSVGRLGPLR